MSSRMSTNVTPITMVAACGDQLQRVIQIRTRSSSVRASRCPATRGRRTRTTLNREAHEPGHDGGDPEHRRGKQNVHDGPYETKTSAGRTCIATRANGDEVTCAASSFPASCR